MGRRVIPTFHDQRLGDDLLWRDVRVQRFVRPRPALFLDRDGVMIEEKNYLRDPQEVELLPGVPELIAAAKGMGWAVVEITNQAGIAHGHLDWPDFVAVEDRITQVLEAKGVRVDAVFACPFHRAGRAPYGHPDHPWRKPNPGMLNEAVRVLNLIPSESVLVGDKDIDQRAGRAAGLCRGIHVRTGYGKDHEAAALAAASDRYTVLAAGDAFEAQSLLVSERSWSQAK